MEAVPLHRIAIVLPFTRFLAELGAPVEAGLQRVKLPVLALDDVNAYVPSQRFWAFAGNMALREGIDNLGFRVGKGFGANCGDPNFSKILERSPTLYHGLKTTCQLVAKTTSRSHMWLSKSSPEGSIKFIHHASFDASNRHISQMDWFAIMGMIGIVQVFAGPGWQPKSIGLTSRDEPARSIREQLPGTRLLLAQEYSCISVENSLLGLPPLTRTSKVLNDVPQPHEIVSTDFAGSLKQALQSYLKESRPTIELAAEICSISTRSLQRKLKSCGLTYSGLVDQAHFDAAKILLQDQDMNVTDIAHALSFDDASHFSRTFRRVAGVSPREFRQRAI